MISRFLSSLQRSSLLKKVLMVIHIVRTSGRHWVIRIPIEHGTSVES